MQYRSVVLLVCVGMVPLHAADWLLHRGDPAQTGIATAQLPEQLDIRWEFKAKDSIEGAPAIHNGIVYVASTDHHLYALDLKTGQEKWKTKLGVMKASPSIRGDRIYVGDSDNKFHAVELATGKLLWSFETDGEVTAAANFAGETILIPSQDSTLYCLSKEGKKVWDFRTEGPIFGGVAVVENKTFVAGCDSLMHVLDTKTGKELGNVDLKGQTGASAAVVGDRLYVGTMSNQVMAVDLTKLRIDWEFEAPRRRQAFYGSAAVTNDLVIIGSRDNKMWAIDRKTGKAKWDFLTDHKVDGSAVVVGKYVYFGSFDARFYVLEVATGKKVQSLTLDGPILGSPAVADDCLIIGTEKGTVYCLGKKN
jgi:outer membrane protein assembly factor BamB